ncbi:hypothetical protein MJO29_013590 [Puccinia striiformis f. sp. tritici]
MIPFIHHLSPILFSDVPLPPTPEEVTGLSPGSVYSWFINCLGWHEPSLPDAVKWNVRRRFESVPLILRRRLLRSDLLPHRVYPPDSFGVDDQSMRILYQITGAFRQLAVRNIHHVYRNPSRNVDPYPDSHRLWLPEAEKNWLRMREGMREAAQGKLIDFPISMHFTLSRPQYPRSVGVKRTMILDSRANYDPGPEDDGITDDDANDGYWPLQFHSQSRPLEIRPSITFSRQARANRLGIDLPASLQTLGLLWIENAKWGPNNRVLFQKLCHDKDIGILLWPTFPEEDHPTPRIPVFYSDIIQVVEGDRLLIFVGTERGLEDAVLQIKVTCTWHSGYLPTYHTHYADKKYVYPNPCERYPHCVQRPIYRPSTAKVPKVLQASVRPRSTYTWNQVQEEELSPSSQASRRFMNPPGPRYATGASASSSSIVTRDAELHRTSNSFPRSTIKTQDDSWDQEVIVEVVETLDYVEDLTFDTSFFESTRQTSTVRDHPCDPSDPWYGGIHVEVLERSIDGDDEQGTGASLDVARKAERNNDETATAPAQTDAPSHMETAPAPLESEPAPPANGSPPTKRKRDQLNDRPARSGPSKRPRRVRSEVKTSPSEPEQNCKATTSDTVGEGRVTRRSARSNRQAKSGLSTDSKQSKRVPLGDVSSLDKVSKPAASNKRTGISSMGGSTTTKRKREEDDGGSDGSHPLRRSKRTRRPPDSVYHCR